MAKVLLLSNLKFYIMTKNITFTLPAEALDGASEAFLLGDFNNWTLENAPKLEKQKDGTFKTSAKLEEGKTYQYRFLLNDGRWVNDYNAQRYTSVDGLHVDNCVITVPFSKTEETKKVQPGKRTIAVKEDQVSVKGARKTVDTKSTAVKTSTRKPVKSTASKTASTSIEKPVKAAKKSAPKTNK
jgi:hypothetical protein